MLRTMFLNRFALQAALRFLALLIYFSPTLAQPESLRPEIWFAPMPPVIRPDGSQAGSADYFGLFEPRASWTSTAKDVAVFKIYPELLRSASDEQLREIFAGLASRHIKLALEAPVLVDTGGGGCVPNASHASWLAPLVMRLKRLGGDLREFAMVGPLVNGHNALQLTGCHRPIDEVVADAARSVARIRGLYPDISVGEIEPVGQGPAFPNWSELDYWFEAWSRVNGRPLNFLHLDTGWGLSWHDDMQIVARKTRAAGIRFGVIYKGEPYDISDASFVTAALEHANEVEDVLGGPPDQVIIQSWENYPRHALPDSDLTTMTGFLRAYLRPRTQLVLCPSGLIKLLSGSSAPIKNAEVTVELHDPAPDKSLQYQEIRGVVPHTAVSALFAIRIHAECNCAAKASELSLSGLTFEQPHDRYFDWSASSWATGIRGMTQAVSSTGESVLRINVSANQKVILNGQKFSVFADQPFTTRFRWQVEPTSDGTGLVTVIFLDKNAHEVIRVPHLFHTSWSEFARLRTDTNGTISLPPLPESPAVNKRLRFAGDLQYRGSILPISEKPR